MYVFDILQREGSRERERERGRKKWRDRRREGIYNSGIISLVIDNNLVAFLWTNSRHIMSINIIIWKPE